MRSRAKFGGGIALVSGAGAGIGRATALALAADGAHVLVTDVDLAAAELVAKEIAAAGGRATAHHLDVTDADAVRDLATAVGTEHGALDVLVCNAGVGMSGRLADITVDDWRWIRSVNLDGVLHCCHAFAPAMLERGTGHVVIVSSGLGYTPRASEPAYVTTKAAVLALAQCLRADWAGRGVGVSAVCPGVVNTGILDRTRFVGAGAGDEARARRIFARGHKAEKIAVAILRAVRRNRGVVAAGWESKLGWWAHRLLPIWMQQRVARVGL